MKKPDLTVITGGAKRAALTSEILKEVADPNWNRQRVENMVDELRQSARPSLKIVSKEGR